MYVVLRFRSLHFVGLITVENEEANGRHWTIIFYFSFSVPIFFLFFAFSFLFLFLDFFLMPSFDTSSARLLPFTAAFEIDMSIFFCCFLRCWCFQRFLREGDWYANLEMSTGMISRTMFENLMAFWPGMQILMGGCDSAFFLFVFDDMLCVFFFHPFCTFVVIS